MRVVILKSLLAGLLSLLASLALSFIFVPMMGGQVAGAGLVMTIVCPLAIGIPASGILFYQAERIRKAEAATVKALLEVANAYEDLRLQSRRDRLTGLLNRHTFQEDLAGFSSAGVTGALIFLDLDHFKSINDRFGHATGDEALRRTGRVLAAYQGETEIAGRLGGEEFALFRAGMEPNDIPALCEEIRALIEHMDIRAPSGARVAVSTSIGAFYCAAGFDADECLRAADVNLYEAKSQGRNRVVTSL